MEIIFIYNAKSGKLDKLMDFAHKILSPSTYACDLCSLTHHDFGKRGEWKSFLEHEDFKIKVYYKNQFEKEFDEKFSYPVILVNKSSEFEVLLNKNEIGQLENLSDLLAEVLKKTKSQS